MGATCIVASEIQALCRPSANCKYKFAEFHENIVNYATMHVAPMMHLQNQFLISKKKGIKLFKIKLYNHKR